MLGIFEIEDALAAMGVLSIAVLAGLIIATAAFVRWIRHP